MRRLTNLIAGAGILASSLVGCSDNEPPKLDVFDRLIGNTIEGYEIRADKNDQIFHIRSNTTNQDWFDPFFAGENAYQFDYTLSDSTKFYANEALESTKRFLYWLEMDKDASRRKASRGISK